MSGHRQHEDDQAFRSLFAPRQMYKDDGQASYIGGSLDTHVDRQPFSTGRPAAQSSSNQQVSSEVRHESDDERIPLALPRVQRNEGLVIEESSRSVEGGAFSSTEDIHFGPVSDNLKPEPTYFALLKHAFLFSPQKKLTLGQIYEALEGRWPWFSYAGKGWKNTVRNVLSLGPSFQKATDGEPAHRAQGGGERGVYWSFDSNAIEGCPRGDRTRKRNRKTSVAEDGALGSPTKARGRKVSGTIPGGDAAVQVDGMSGIVEQDLLDHDGDHSEHSSKRGSRDDLSLTKQDDLAPSLGSGASPPRAPGGKPAAVDDLHAVMSRSRSKLESSPIHIPNARASGGPARPVRSLSWAGRPGSSGGPQSSLFADDPPVAPSSSALSSPVSTTSPPMLSPSSASTSFSSLDEWFTPVGMGPPSWMAGFEGSLTLSTMDEDGPGSSDTPSAFQPGRESAARGMLLCPSGAGESPLVEFAAPSSDLGDMDVDVPPSKTGNLQLGLLTPKMNSVAPSHAARRGHQSKPVHRSEARSAPISSKELELGPPTDPSDSVSSLGSVELKMGHKQSTNSPPLPACGGALGLVGLEPPTRVGLATAGDHLPAQKADVPPAYDLTLLAGRSSEFWRGLWEGWNAESPEGLEGREAERRTREEGEIEAR